MYIMPVAVLLLNDFLHAKEVLIIHIKLLVV
jgi:hypothetical protein